MLQLVDGGFLLRDGMASATFWFGRGSVMVRFACLFASYDC
jgi:hypothetical protein